MPEINFCPVCNAAQHKMLLCKKDIFFCKECNNFFKLKWLELRCPRCDNDKIIKSDFPSPSGEVVFQCTKCKRTFSASEFFKANKIK